ncbi:MAG TPA: hypothetical protein PLA43_19130 [Bryobacteraceae bacterium]|nr:hypothetical protein [Bryobacteraceae bacterium]HPU74072.1 hypothetical protein [Bryobacteraceae bacterium]
MASARRSKRTELNAYLEEKRPEKITEAEWAELLTRLAPVSESYLRRLLRESGVPLVPVVAGVRQGSLAELERSLLELGEEYARAREAGDKARERLCRCLVIEAKDHARWALRRGRTEKEEMILWMLTWLENPGIFPAWVKLRKNAVGKTATEPESPR